jgi:streptomycin 6-kinase
MRPPPEALLRRFDLRDPDWVAGTRHAQVWKVRLRSGDWGALKHYPAGHLSNEATGLLFLERANGERSRDAAPARSCTGQS